MTVHQRTEKWLADFIVGYDLCPFAKRPLLQGTVRIRVVDSDQEPAVTRAFLEELERLVTTPRAILETTLLVIPQQLHDFGDFWDYCTWIHELLAESGAEGLVQTVGFHPEYVFAGAAPDDAANYTNRSPYPLIHLLREESVSEAVLAYPDISAIPARNIARLRALDKVALEAGRQLPG